MPDARIFVLPRLDLPKPPTTNPAYYTEGDEIRGLSSIWMHTPEDIWWNRQQARRASDVPTGLKPIGVLEQ